MNSMKIMFKYDPISVSVFGTMCTVPTGLRFYVSVHCSLLQLGKVYSVENAFYAVNFNKVYACSYILTMAGLCGNHILCCHL